MTGISVLSRSQEMPAERKRPWFLVLALLGALALGTTGAYEGWNGAALYFVSVDPSKVGQGITDDHDRALVVSRVQDYVQVLDAEKSRGWPFSVAALLLGSATLLFAMRALGGSAGARTALIQLVIAQAATGIAAHYLLRDVVDADLRWNEAVAAAEAHAAGSSGQLAPAPSLAVFRAASTLFLVLRTIGSALVVVGLTRHRSRAYFDETATVEEG
jgi:hypothetical protein